MKSCLLIIVFTIFPFTAAIFHLWTTIIAFSESGLSAALLTIALPILSEIYWIFKMWGVNETYTSLGIAHLICAFLWSVIGNG
jgi:hypothetical protein